MIGKIVWTYRNLNKGGFSIMISNKVVKHTNFIVLEDVEFRVREGGRIRARKDGQRNVHAFAIGTLITYDKQTVKVTGKFIEITYDPFKHESFIVKKTGKPIYEASFAVLIDEKLFVEI
jgi:hypothetical protein